MTLIRDLLEYLFQLGHERGRQMTILQKDPFAQLDAFLDGLTG